MNKNLKGLKRNLHKNKSNMPEKSPPALSGSWLPLLGLPAVKIRSFLTHFQFSPLNKLLLVRNCRPLRNLVRYGLSWGCYELLPTMKLCPLRVELRLLRTVAHYETSSVTSWVEAVTSCRPLWNFVRYELSWGCNDLSPAMKLRSLRFSWGCCDLLPTMKLRPLRVELRLLRIVARYETSSVTSWFETVTSCRPLWNFVRYE